MTLPAKNIPPDIKRLRKTIALLDVSLTRIIARRMALCAQIGALKKKYGLKIKDPQREKMLLGVVEKRAKKLGLSPLLMGQIFCTLLKESRRVQNNI